MHAFAVVFLLSFAASDVDAAVRDVDGGVPDAGVSELPLPLPKAAPPATEPPAVLTGRVLARGGREPLVAATITLGLDVIGETDEQGRFRVELAPGRHRLQFAQPGYDPFELPVVAVPGAVLPERTIRLQPRLRGQRFETIVHPPGTGVTQHTLAGEEMRQTPGSLGDPLRVIESLPGVSQVVWPLALYAIRGANPGNTGFFVDGVRLPALYHLALGPSVIHPYFLEQVDFYPGGYPLQLGRFVAGVVSAKTTTLTTDRTRGSVDVRLFDAGGIVVTPINGGAGAVAIAGRVSYTGLLFSLLSPDYTFTYWDYQTRLEHRLGPGKLTIFAFGSGDSLGRKEETDGDANVAFHRVDLRWDGSVAGGRLRIGGIVGYDDAGTAIRQLVRLPIAVKTLSGGGRLDYVRPIGSWFALESGGDVEWKRFRPSSQLPVAQEQDVFRNRTAVMAGAYLGAQITPGSRLVLSPGARLDYYGEEGRHVADVGPRLGVRVRAGDQVWLKAMAGRYTQMPSVPVAVPGFEGFGLQSYGLQWSWQGSAGVEAPLGRLLTVDATGFLQRFQLTDLASQFEYDPQQRLLEKRDGRSYGLELLLRRPIQERFYGWLAYTLSRSERVFPPLNVTGPSDWDQRHILNLVLGYRFNGGYTFGTRVHYNSGRPYPVYVLPPAPAQAPEYTRLPDFYQLDLRLDKRFIFDRYLLDVYIEVVNTTATKELFDLKRTADGRRDERAYRIVLPSIGMHAEW